LLREAVEDVKMSYELAESEDGRKSESVGLVEPGEL
jgi:hypothetical protein